MFQPIFARGSRPETFKGSFSRTNQTANKQRRQKKPVKTFLNFTFLHKTQQGQKIAGNFPNFLKISIRLMSGYPGLNAGLNTSRFGGDIAFLKGKIGRGLPSLVYAISIQVIKPPFTD